MLHDATGQVTTARAPEAEGGAGLVPMLSVFLLLLAFFILLVSMVEFDESRTQAALGSISSTFAAKRDLPAGETGAAIGAEGALRNLIVEIGAVLPLLLRDGTYSVSREGALAVIRVDNAELFASGLTPAPALVALADRLTGLMATPPAGLRFAVDVIAPFGERGATRRAGLVVRAFEKAGIAASDLTASLVAGPAGQTRLEIYATTLAAPDDDAAASGAAIR